MRDTEDQKGHGVSLLALHSIFKGFLMWIKYQMCLVNLVNFISTDLGKQKMNVILQDGKSVDAKV